MIITLLIAIAVGLVAVLLSSYKDAKQIHDKDKFNSGYDKNDFDVPDDK